MPRELSSDDVAELLQKIGITFIFRQAGITKTEAEKLLKGEKLNR